MFYPLRLHRPLRSNPPSLSTLFHPPSPHLSSFFCCWGAHLRSSRLHYHNHHFPLLWQSCNKYFSLAPSFGTPSCSWSIPCRTRETSKYMTIGICVASLLAAVEGHCRCDQDRCHFSPPVLHNSSVFHLARWTRHTAFIRLHGCRESIRHGQTTDVITVLRRAQENDRDDGAAGRGAHNGRQQHDTCCHAAFLFRVRSKYRSKALVAGAR